ncbi:hypothetical protein J8273_7415 [Carpediemonas membranifera]|uniref:Importin N-terminal domain-containing protein n=1 Tax=Carpediemonas membranifera TaxID=201153 RepID=A0A8J6AQ89_9EUKA|nr:hypothetical protein J8273_7415 [Carpediemonas membranifera]|eukprot:KAG9391141.1 hypothetical protein J8273_7415 [Carpediemonas membranifera]
MELKSAILRVCNPQGNMKEFKAAEKYLSSLLSNTELGQALIGLITSDFANDEAATLSTSLLLKNWVNRVWPDKEERGLYNDEQIRLQILQVYFEKSGHPVISNVFMAALRTILTTDYPVWQGFIDNCISMLNSAMQRSALHEAAAVLRLIHVATKTRFRDGEDIDQLVPELRALLDQFCQPMMAHMQALFTALPQPPNEVDRPLAMRCVMYLLKIWSTLNWHTVPEFFEDNLPTFTQMFAFILEARNDFMSAAPEDKTMLVKAQTATVRNVRFCVTHIDEGDFKDYVSKFTPLIWTLLQSLSAAATLDSLAIACIQYVQSIATSPYYFHTLREPETLRTIVKSVVLPSLAVRDEDVDEFEMNPRQFVQLDLDHFSDAEYSRAGAASELVSALCIHFEQPVLAVAVEKLDSVLQTTPVTEASRILAIKFFSSISIVGFILKRGVTSIRCDEPTLYGFLEQHVVPALTAQDPMLVAAAIKFIAFFRPYLQPRHITACITQLWEKLEADCYVVSAYSAYTLDYLLRMQKDGQPVIPFESISGRVMSAFTVVFSRLTREDEWGTCSQLLKLAIRLLVQAPAPLALAVSKDVYATLSGIVLRIAKDPSVPMFNHLVFEALALVIARIVAADAPEAFDQLEASVFESINYIVTENVVEFQSYAFQFIAQMLTCRPAVTERYQAVLAAITASESLWLERGNIPALAKVIQVYVRKEPAAFASEEIFAKVFEIVKKLVLSVKTEFYGIELVQTFVAAAPVEVVVSPDRGTRLVKLLFQRAQKKATPVYMANFSAMLCLAVHRVGPGAFVGILEGIQQGFSAMAITNVVCANIGKLAATNLDQYQWKYAVVGLSELAASAPGAQLHHFLLPALSHALVNYRKTASTSRVTQRDMTVKDPEDGFQAAYVALSFAGPQVVDFMDGVGVETLVQGAVEAVRASGSADQSAVAAAQSIVETLAH